MDYWYRCCTYSCVWFRAVCINLDVVFILYVLIRLWNSFLNLDLVVDSFWNFVRSRSMVGLESSQKGVFWYFICWVCVWLKFISFRSDWILRLIGLIGFCMFSNLWMTLFGVSKRQLWTGLSVVALILVAYCKVSCFLLSSKGRTKASAWRLVSGDVLKAPRASRSPWFWIGLSIFKYEGRADP